MKTHNKRKLDQLHDEETDEEETDEEETDEEETDEEETDEEETDEGETDKDETDEEETDEEETDEEETDEGETDKEENNEEESEEEEEIDEEEIDEEEIDEEETDEEEIDDSNFEEKDAIDIIIMKINDKDLTQMINDEKALLADNEKIITNFVKVSTFAELQYVKQFLSKEEKIKFAFEQKRLMEINNDIIPLKFQILSSDIDDKIKALAFKKLNNLRTMCPSNGEYNKLKNYINSLCMIPFGKIKSLPVDLKDGKDKITSFLKKVKQDFDTNIYGHTEAKDQIIRIIAQWVSNPNSKGNVIGIHGKPGVGKTTLIKDGLSKALALPFAFVPLGGAHDSSFLDGHSYTYEGSTWGKITECLMNAKFMNPIIYFDELDKISDSNKGREIENVLIHMTDPGQNSNFNDKFFSEIDIDLSKVLIIFTYNDDNLINPILKDRMIRIETKDYDKNDKFHIMRKHLIPELLSQFNMAPDNLIISNEIMYEIIQSTDNEAGVRNLKRNLESIISSINLNVLLGEAHYPYTISKNTLNKYTRKIENKCSSIPHMYL
jgi:ATP-dependent Lon protease